jgi:hypothetical protein
MGFVCEIAVRGDPAAAGLAGPWFDGGPRETWLQLPQLASFDVYVPADAAARDPFVDDGAGPLMLVTLDFTSVGALRAALSGDAIADAASRLPAGMSATVTALERRYYPVAGQSTVGLLAAPFSYLVRYHRPAENETAFVANYLASHPPTLARLPDIRSIICYFPIDDCDDRRLPSAGYIIGNEVAFDTIEAFNAAMASPVRLELRAHYRAFPPFTGANTHYLMRRTRLVG